MTSFVSARDDAPPSAGVDTTGSLRAMLRDTALLVTTLTARGQVDDADAFRARCRQLIEQFSAALARSPYPDDVRNEARIAQCGMLDEAALRHLPAERRAAWRETPLQVEHFDLHDAGERVIGCLEARLRETPPQRDLLECYSAILGMGFEGRFSRGHEARRDALLAALNTRLESLRPEAAPAFVADRAQRRLSDWLRRLSPWAIAGLAGGVALIAWLACAAALDAQVAHLLPAAVVNP